MERVRFKPGVREGAIYGKSCAIYGKSCDGEWDELICAEVGES